MLLLLAKDNPFLIEYVIIRLMKKFPYLKGKIPK